MIRTELNEEELRRHEVLSRVGRKELPLREAAGLLRVSYAQAKRLRKRYREGGATALRHGNTGRRSNRAKPEALRERVLELVREKYGGGEEDGFGPTLAAEHLESDHGIRIDATTLRKWMLTEGLWKRAAQAQAAETPTGAEGAFRGAAAAGREPSQVAGRARAEGVSDEPGGRRDRGAQCLFAEEETTWAAADLLERWVRFYGVPQALYTDWSTVYLRKATERERLEGVEPATQFGTMCEKLGIEIIGAGSAQAKGRVERANGTHQDRLIKKLRLRGINGYGEANLYLANEYLPEHNERFQREPASEVDYHRSVAGGAGPAAGVLPGAGAGDRIGHGGALRESVPAIAGEAQPTGLAGDARDGAAMAGRKPGCASRRHPPTAQGTGAEASEAATGGRPGAASGQAVQPSSLAALSGGGAEGVNGPTAGTVPPARDAARLA